jgi:uncharacterized protein (DUF697 family)
MPKDKMWDKGKGGDKKMKVQRPRRRIYEAPVEEAVAQPDATMVKNKAPEVALAELSRKSAVIATRPADQIVPAVAGTVKPEALDIVKSHVIYSMGVAATPVPLLDIAGASVLILKMLKTLSELYGVDYSRRKGMKIATSAIGGAGPLWASGLGASLIMTAAPIFGALVGLAARPIFAGATVYAIGITFACHFESGGSMEDMNLAASRECFKKLFSEGKSYSAGLRKGGASSQNAHCNEPRGDTGPSLFYN